MGCSSADRLGTWGGKGSQGERGGRWAPAERMRRPGKDRKLGTRGEEGPSEGGDRIDSLIPTPELNYFLVGGRGSNRQVLERPRAGKVGVCTCVGGGGQQEGLAVQAGGGFMGCPIKPPPPGAATIVSCGSSHRRLPA